MGCVYKFKLGGLGVTPELTEELLLTVLRSAKGIDWNQSGSSLMDNIITSLSSGVIKYSLLEDHYKKIETLFNEEKTKRTEARLNTNNFSDDPYTFTNDTISAARLIELKHKELGTIASATNIDDYVRNEELKIDPTATPEAKAEEEARITRTVLLWEISKQDGRLLHGYLPRAWTLSYKSEKDRNKEFDKDAQEQNENGIPSLFYQLKDRFKDTETAKQLIQECMNLVNVTIHSMLKPLDNEDKWKAKSGHISAKLLDNVIPDIKRVAANIDRIYIDNLGRVHVFILKFSTNQSKDWAEAKKQKYILELAVIKEILRQNGIDVTGASFYYLPITLKYDMDSIQYNPDKTIQDIKIESINVEKPISANIANSGTLSPIVKHEPEIKELFPQSEVKPDLNYINFDFDLDEATALISAVNPEYNAELTGLRISANAYIANEKGKSINISEDGKHWNILLPSGKIISTKTLDRKELFETVNEHLTELDIKLNVIVSEMVKSVESSYSLGTAMFEDFGFKHNRLFLQEKLSRYFLREKGEEPHWVPLIHLSLSQLGIFLFQNKYTGQIDVVKFSALKLNEKIPVKRGQNGLLGYYEMDMEGLTKLQSSYGDMELLFVTAIINQLIPKLNSPKFGLIHIISPYYRGESRYTTGSFSSTEFNKIINYVNAKPEINHKFKNNFMLQNLIDPVECIFQQIEAIKNYHDIPKSVVEKINHGLVLSELRRAQTQSAKVQAILEVMQYIEVYFNTDDREKIVDKLHDHLTSNRLLAQIYVDCASYLSKCLGVEMPLVKKHSSFKKMVLRTDSHPDENLRSVGYLYAQELDEGAYDYQKEYSPIRTAILKFYDSKNFTVGLLAVIGSAKNLYQKMYKRDRDTGKMLWEFVNPYNNAECIEYNLDKDEIKFLKFALFLLAKIRARAKGKTFNFTSVEDPKLQEYINNKDNNYFIVPLLKRSNNAVENISDFIRRSKLTFRLLANSKDLQLALSTVFETHEKRMIDEATKEESIYEMDVVNKMIMSEDPEGRAVMLLAHDDNYFETNLEYILSEYLFSDINYKHMKTIELKCKAILVRMLLQAYEAGPRLKVIIDESMKEVDDFMKLNIYGKSLMSEFGLDFVNFMSPYKKVATNLLIAGNLRSAFRDMFEGLMHNTIRTLNKFGTDLSVENVYKGYGVVLKNIFNNDRMLNIVSELCLRYRLSNTDAAKINERSKFGKGGIFNPSYLGFSTLRGPDFLNRMTLFVARCLQDGTFYAYDLNEDLQLVYHADRDERFKIFFQDLTEHPKYQESKAAYFSAVKQWNDTHNQEDLISYDKTINQLPEPYSFQEIESFKEFSNMIYAAYDTYAKAKYEHVALGQTLGVFSTWFNGITAAWLRERGEYYSHFKTKDEEGNILIKHNEAGNELYFDKDGNILEKTQNGIYYNDHNEIVEVDEKELVPVIDRIPIQVQGILYTFKDIWHVLREDGWDGINLLSKDSAWNLKIWKYSSNRANIYRVLSDFIMMMIFFFLFGLVFKKGYQEHKKKKEADNLIGDLGVELLFKSSYNAFDGFLGPIAVANYIFDEMDPTAAKFNLNLMNLAMNVMMGRKSWKAFIYSNTPVFRTFKDTIKMYSPEASKVSESS